MASAVEQVFRNFSWAAWRRAHGLHRSLWFLLFALLAVRLGTFIPLPGVDGRAWAEAFEPFRGLLPF